MSLVPVGVDAVVIDPLRKIYSDSDGRIRKYANQYCISDGSHDYIDLLAYYDINGELV